MSQTERTISEMADSNMSPPRLGWDVVLLHIILASIASWLIYSLTKNNETFVGFVQSISSIVPSIPGMADNSSNPYWAKIYLSLCWIGVPFYFVKFWNIGSYALPVWVDNNTRSRLWFVASCGFIGSLAILFFPRVDDGRRSLKSMAALEQMMNESYLVYVLVGYTMVLAFSLGLAASIKLIQLRLTK